MGAVKYLNERLSNEEEVSESFSFTWHFTSKIPYDIHLKHAAFLRTAVCGVHGRLKTATGKAIM